MNYRLTFDFGSGSVKAALTDERFHALGVENEPYPTCFPRLGQAVQKPGEQWRAMCRATRRLMDGSGIDPAQIEGIAMAQTATTVIFVDNAGRPLTDCVMWMDGRAEKQAVWINQKLGEKRFSGKNVIAKLRWFLENEPQVVEQADQMLDVSALLFHRMTGEWAYEFTGARATCLVDLERRCWDNAMFDLIDFPRRLVPDRIVGSTEMVGRLTETAAEELGLAQGIPVFGGCSDHATAILGTGCIRPGDAHIYIGTSAWLAVATPDHIPKPGRMPSPVPGMRYHFYDTDSGGSCFDFLLSTYYTREAAEGKNAMAVMDGEVLETVERDEGEDLLFLPFMAGASAPISNTTVRASLLNITRSTQRRHIARAVMEGVCFNLRWMRDLHALEHGWMPNFLRGVGGGMKSAVLLQMLADVLDTPVTPLENPRFAGNIGLQSCIEVGLGREPDFSVLDRVVKCGETYLPRSCRRERYDRLYALYRESYAALEPVYQKLNAQ